MSPVGLWSPIPIYFIAALTTGVVSKQKQSHHHVFPSDLISYRLSVLCLDLSWLFLHSLWDHASFEPLPRFF